MRTMRTILHGLMVAQLLACSQKDEEEDIEEITEGPDPMGQWVAPCESGTSGISEQLVFDGQAHTVGLDQFSSLDCTAGQISEWRIVSTYQRVKAAPDGHGAHPLNLTYVDVTVKFTNATFVQQALDENLCEVNTWTLGEAQSLSGKSCTGSLESLNAFIGVIGQTRTVYYKVTENKMQIVDSVSGALGKEYVKL